MPPIHILMKPASGLCDLRCAYCFYTDETVKREQSSYGFMSEETLEQIIKKSLEIAEGDCTFAYQGGEPTLRGLDFFKKAIEFQKLYNINGVTIHNAIQTNGYTLDESWCNFLAENQFLVGISIDGTMRTHDRNRKNTKGEGTYSKVMETVSLMAHHHVEYNVLTVVNKQTASQIHKIYREYKIHGLNYQQYIACLDPLFEEAGRHPYSLTPQMYGQFLIDLFQLWYDDWKLKKQPYIRQFENYIGILLGYPPESCEQNGICGYQNVIEADGSIYPCDFYMLDEYRLGNLTKDSFEEINKKRNEIKFIESSVNHALICRQCRYFSLCRGGCRRHRVYKEEEAGSMNYFCESYKMFFDEHLPKLREIAETL